MRATLNPHWSPARVAPPSSDAATFHSNLPGYRPTPVVRLVEVAARLGVRSVVVKDESDRFGLPAFKILGASWAVEQALRLDSGIEMLVAASAGNHGRAVAWEAARRGLRSRIFLPARSLHVRRDAITAEGAEVVIVDGSYEDAVALAEASAAAAGACLVADVGETGCPAWVIDGYATLFREASSQVKVDTILVPVGVGALAAAAARHGAEVGAAVLGVEPATAA